MLDLCVGITTAPRKESTLWPCLNSWDEAGAKPTVFCEPENPPPVTPFTEIHFPEKMGHYRSWMYAARHLLEQQTEFVCLGEDDAVVHPKSLDYINTFASQGRILSLYSSEREMKNRWLGVFSVKRGKKFADSLALVFHRDDLQALIWSDVASLWPARSPEVPIERINCVDKMVGEWALVADVKILEPNPSLCQHIGATSTLGHGELNESHVAHNLLSHDRNLPWNPDGTIYAKFSSFIEQSCCSSPVALLHAAGMPVLAKVKDIPKDTRSGDMVSVPMKL